MGVLLLGASMLFAQSTQTVATKKSVFGDGITVLTSSTMLLATPVGPSDASRGPSPCVASADTWNDLGAAPCLDAVTSLCNIADAGFTAFGVYGSETYTLTDVQAGFDYVFDMCSGVGAANWIPEVTILAPDGTTIDADNAASSGSGQTHADQCTISWTASQSGTYSIVINEMGTAAGDAPNQTGCEVSFATDNGNPTVVCGANPAACPTAGPCDAGTLTSATSQDVCPGDSAVFAMSGTLAADGGFVLNFSDALGGTGGQTGGFSIGYADTDFPLSVDNDVNGILSANSLPLLLGEWVITIFALDAQDVPCDSVAPVTVNFLPASDPSCPNAISEQSLNLDIYPNPSNGSIIISMTGDNSVGSINVYDMTGRVVYSESAILSSNYRNNLDLDVVDGTYVLSIVGAETVITRKLQIRR